MHDPTSNADLFIVLKQSFYRIYLIYLIVQRASRRNTPQHILPYYLKVKQDAMGAYICTPLYSTVVIHLLMDTHKIRA